MIKKLLAAALVLTAALTMPQAAPAQSPPDERAAAREFAYAAYRLRVTIKSAVPEMRRQMALADASACAVAFRAGDDPDDLPRRVQIGFGVVLTEFELGVRYGPIRDALSTFVAELDRIATADPALVAGRESWRTQASFLATTGPVPPDLCERFVAWRRAGAPLSAIPAAQPDAFHRQIVEAVRQNLEQGPPSGPVDRRKERGAARMAELGVPQGQADRFVGESLFRGTPSLITVGPGEVD